MLLCATFALSACDDNGGFSLSALTGGAAAEDAGEAGQERRVAAAGTSTQDVERPDVFDVTANGLWDGRPSLGGIWVAHPDVGDPERVIMRNTSNGQSVIGALFRRERDNPGPPLQVSSDAAEALGMLAGAPAELSVVALRREEVDVPAENPEANPVVAGLDAPVSVTQTPLQDTGAAAGAAVGAAASAATTAAAAAPATAPIEVNLPPAPTPAPAAAPPDIEVSAPAVPVELEATLPPAPAPASVPMPTGLLVQIGIFSVQQNAQAAAIRLRGLDVPAAVVDQQAGGRTVWRVVAGPANSVAEQSALVAQARELGYPDSYGFEQQ